MKHLILGIIVLFLASFTAAQAGTPCNGTDFSGTGCEITNVVPTGSLMCIKFLGGQCPAGKLPGFFGVFDKSGVPFHVVVDDDGAYYVTRADEADGQGDLVRIIPGGDPNTGYGGEIIGRGFNPEGLAFDPISKKFYTAHSRSSFRAVFSIPKAGADPPNFGATIFFGGGTTQLFSEGVAVNSSGTVFATAFNSGGAIFNATRRRNHDFAI